MTLLLSVKHLNAALGRRQVLEDISFDLAAGEFIGLIGPNGAGKSTLLRSILGLVPHGGNVLSSGQDVAGLTARERAAHIAYLPQERDIAWPVSVEMVVSLGRLARKGAFGGSAVSDREIVERAMRRMEIETFRDRTARELSGGEKARVLIARALAQDAPLILADEPTAGLDPAHQIALMSLFRRLAGEGQGVMASLHDLSLAARWCSRLILLDHGRIVADGSPEDVLTAKRLRDVYGVEALIDRAGDGRLLVIPLGPLGEVVR